MDEVILKQSQICKWNSCILKVLPEAVLFGVFGISHVVVGCCMGNEFEIKCVSVCSSGRQRNDYTSVNKILKSEFLE